MAKKLILVKLGGSLITDKTKPFTEDLSIIKRLAKEISQAKKLTKTFLIIGHGGGSYPHAPAKKYQTNQGIINGQSLKGIALVQDAAVKLNRLVVAEFLKAGLKAVTLNPSSFMITQNGEIKQAFLFPLLKLLELKMLPVVYGDVVFDTQKGCCILSTEKILNYLALKLRKDYQINKIVHCGRTNGVYNQKGKTVSQINHQGFKKLKKEIGHSKGIDVTGGMIHKVEEGLKLAKKGVSSEIINGLKPENLKKAILGKPVAGSSMISALNI
jgi:isopentenyl phosphate kinase